MSTTKTNESEFYLLQKEYSDIIKQYEKEKARKLLIQSFKLTCFDFLRIFYPYSKRKFSTNEETAKITIKNLVVNSNAYKDYLQSNSQDKNAIKLYKFMKMEKSRNILEFLPHPVIFDSKKEIFVLMNLGRMPDANQTEFYNSNFIYPVNYRIERIYKNYRSDQSNLLVYTCLIRNKENKLIFEVYDCDKLLVSGRRNCWKTFKDIAHMNNTNIQLEDFFALSNRKIQLMIEEKTNYHSLTGYVSLEKRI